MPTIGLSMIVKNEAKLIRRCLHSVARLVDFIAISDTGSTDDTPDIIEDFLRESGIQGFVKTHKWVDFAYNRNMALASLIPHKEIDYAFMIDADDTLELGVDFNVNTFKASMDKDVYDLTVKHAAVVHSRPQIFRNKPGYHWVGVLHEFLEVPKPFTRAHAPGLTINASIEGSRNADPDKFKKDAEILKKALKNEKSPYMIARNTFYLAQSYRDCLDYENALKYYQICAKISSWDQQSYVSLLETIRTCTKLGGEDQFDAAVSAFKRASALNLRRAEHHHALSFLCRKLGKNAEGAEIAFQALHLPTPQDGLFIEPWVYDYGLRDEYAVNAYWAGQYGNSLKANLQLLASDKTPTGMFKRLADNAKISFEKIPEKPDPFFAFSD